MNQLKSGQPTWLAVWACFGGLAAGPCWATAQQDAVAAALAGKTCSYVAKKLAFYWEIGDSNGPLYYRGITGKPSTTSGKPHANRTQSIPIASASKWLYSTYYVQKHAGYLPQDLPRLSLTSNITAPATINTLGAYTIVCGTYTDVASCAKSITSDYNGYQSNGVTYAFSYGGAHLESLAGEPASDLASKTAATSTTADTLGPAINDPLVGLNLPAGAITYTDASLAGGVSTSPAQYATFLQKMLKGYMGKSDGYIMGGLLDSYSVCATNSYQQDGVPQSTDNDHLGTPCPNPSPKRPDPGTGPAGSVANSPFPYLENARYGLGFWLEMPGTTSAAYSSPGSLGFYPSIDASKRIYVIVSISDAVAPPEAYLDAMYCGRNLRNAWLYGDGSDPYAAYYLHH